MIQIANARKRFGSVTAVDGVSFVAQDGAITGLLGPNGAGKTTTLRMLYAVMKPDSGEVRVDDVDAVATPQAAQARLGVLPDGFGLYPRLTAREHLDYFGALQGIESDSAREANRGTARPARHARDRGSAHCRLLTWRAHEGCAGSRARARPAERPARRTHQRARRHEHARRARPSSGGCATRDAACCSRAT